MSNANLLHARPEKIPGQKNNLKYKPGIVRRKRLKKSVIEIMYADDDVRRWRDNLACSGRLAVNVRARRLGTLQEKRKNTPAEPVMICLSCSKTIRNWPVLL